MAEESIQYRDILEVYRSVHCDIISIVKPTRCTSFSNLFYFVDSALNNAKDRSYLTFYIMADINSIEVSTGNCYKKMKKLSNSIEVSTGNYYKKMKKLSNSIEVSTGNYYKKMKIFQIQLKFQQETITKR